ncbi:glutamate synthase subunit beta [Clostridium sp. 19966]|uniref:glutamate synthase subunit beta n=1 Tax=Clostridium sp. 19966 TaxID=2768166 RepID=UPI0028DF83B1|nr:glutamate synthase subunit beta [Clostridium sp. 19966]MDT8718104.1 glutamate synthase subunit beta [Clostridium sp. 19966]
MGKVTGFKEFQREAPAKRAIEERIKDYKEITILLPSDKLRMQGARCMDCGTPFCNWACPLGNLIPDFNHMVYKGQWKQAYERLALTNPFPEFTGRVCPAPCEGSCTLGANNLPVTIEQLEFAIIEKAYEEGWVKADSPRVRTGKYVAVIGSGPSGLAVASKLNSYGHWVTVFEKDDEVGGLLRYGIPDFKLEKRFVERRADLMKAAGITFKTNCEVGENYSVYELKRNFDAIVLTGGCQVPRDLSVEGREFDGVHFAMDYLTQQNRRNANKNIASREINAKGKTVLVIGGGDTGSDCIGTAIRQGAKEVYQYEIMPKPPVERDETMPWPEYPRTLKISTSHEEGCIREWLVNTKKIEGKDGKVKAIHGVKVQWIKDEAGRMRMEEVTGTEFVQQVDLVIIAMGFVKPKHIGLLEDLGVEFDARGNVKTNDKYMTSVEGVFSAGDMRTGQSLVVRALAEGVKSAESVDKYLMPDGSDW